MPELSKHVATERWTARRRQARLPLPVGVSGASRRRAPMLLGEGSLPGFVRDSQRATAPLRLQWQYPRERFSIPDRPPAPTLRRRDAPIPSQEVSCASALSTFFRLFSEQSQ